MRVGGITMSRGGVVLRLGAVHDQPPAAHVGAPVPAVHDDQLPLAARVLAPVVRAHQGPRAEIGKTWRVFCTIGDTRYLWQLTNVTG